MIDSVSEAMRRVDNPSGIRQTEPMLSSSIVLILSLVTIGALRQRRKLLASR